MDRQIMTQGRAVAHVQSGLSRLPHAVPTDPTLPHPRNGGNLERSPLSPTITGACAFPLDGNPASHEKPPPTAKRSTKKPSHMRQIADLAAVSDT
jgi:hypothetical protein